MITAPEIDSLASKFTTKELSNITELLTLLRRICLLSGGVNKIQTGTDTGAPGAANTLVSNVITLSKSVNAAKCVILLNVLDKSNLAGVALTVSARMLSSTQFQIDYMTNALGAGSASVDWQVIESS